MSEQHLTSTPSLSYTTQKDGKNFNYIQALQNLRLINKRGKKKKFSENGIRKYDQQRRSTTAIPTSLIAPDLIFDCIIHHFLKCAPVLKHPLVQFIDSQITTMICPN